MSAREIEALDAEALARKEEALRRMNAALDAEMPDLAEVDAVIARAARDEAILAAPKPRAAPPRSPSRREQWLDTAAHGRDALALRAARRGAPVHGVAAAHGRLRLARRRARRDAGRLEAS